MISCGAACCLVQSYGLLHTLGSCAPVSLESFFSKLAICLTYICDLQGSFSLITVLLCFQQPPLAEAWEDQKAQTSTLARPGPQVERSVHIRLSWSWRQEQQVAEVRYSSDSSTSPVDSHRGLGGQPDGGPAYRWKRQHVSQSSLLVTRAEWEGLPAGHASDPASHQVSQY